MPCGVVLVLLLLLLLLLFLMLLYKIYEMRVVAQSILLSVIMYVVFVHVLCVGPAADMLRRILESYEVMLPMMVNMSVSYHNLWTSSRVSVAGTPDHNLRSQLKMELRYADKANTKVKCMVSNLKGNGDQVIAAHILPCASAPVKLVKLGLKKKDLQSSRNGLFLAKELERAFDSLKISFVKSNTLREALYMKIWDDDCRKTRLWEGCKHTIGDYDGAKLKLGSHEPFRRALSYQAYQAFINSSSEDEGPQFYGTPGNYAFAKELKCLKDGFMRDMTNELVNVEEDDEELEKDDGGEELPVESVVKKKKKKKQLQKDEDNKNNDTMRDIKNELVNVEEDDEKLEKPMKRRAKDDGGEELPAESVVKKKWKWKKKNLKQKQPRKDEDNKKN